VNNPQIALGEKLTEEILDSSVINSHLQKVAKGAGWVFIGTIIGTILGFVERAIIARYYTQAQYGVFSLALVLLNIFAVIATLGLQDGAARQIAYYRGKGDDKKVRGIIISSIEIALIASIILSFILFFSSNFISTKIFNDSLLSPVIKIFSIALPFFVLINIFVAIARGFNDVKPRVYFQNILRNVLFISLLIFTLWFGLSFLEVIYAFSFSIIISCFLLAIYIVKKTTSSIKREDRCPCMFLRKELLLFSFPLLISSMLKSIITWTDTLMLGYFKTTAAVGLYNAALPIARFIPITLISMVFVYTPIASQFHSRNMVPLLKKSYITLTKWTFAITLPLFLIFFLFPSITLNFLFGIHYADAGIALQILALGFFIHTFLGPNGATLTAMGKTKLLMWAALISAVSNILLNLVLIPSMGIAGAAVASTFSLTLANIILSVKLYQISKIHPFTRNYLKPIVISVIAAFIIYFIAHNFLTVTFWMLPILFVLFLIVYGLALLFTKSFDREDIDILLVMEKRFGINFQIIKKLLGRFF